MSAGPISQWRDGFKNPHISTPQSSALHLAAADRGRAYCGRKSTALTSELSLVSCADCNAAIIADLREPGVR